MNRRYEDLSQVQIDVLQEIGNIGAGNAATSLSMLLNQPINMTLPRIRLVHFGEVAEAVGGVEASSYGVLLSLYGDVDAMILFILDEQYAHQMLNIMVGRQYTYGELDDMALSAIKEVGNILSAAYVKSICDMTGLNIRVTVPFLSIDMAGALLSVPISKFGIMGDKVLYIEDNFSSHSEQVKSHMILFAEMDSLDLILEKLGLA